MRFDPQPYTLREIWLMTEGAAVEEWNLVTAQMALLANCHRDAKKSPVFTPLMFHPYAPRKTRSKPKASLAGFFAMAKANFKHERPQVEDGSVS
jgi:hypothetical protein